MSGQSPQEPSASVSGQGAGDRCDLQQVSEASGLQQHRAVAVQQVKCAVVTVSDSRSIATDRSGTIAVKLLRAAGHTVLDRVLVPDEPELIERLLQRYAEAEQVEAVLFSGGTGISARDNTYETVSKLLTKTLPGYGELFRTLSYEQIGAAAMLSRAVAGLLGTMLVFTMPGSSAATKLALQKLILPELGHLVAEARKRGPG